MKLKGRLKLIADKVQPCKVVCDIGTDHAYLPIYLVLNNVCTRAVASDVGIGPVRSAEENIKRFGLSDLIETRLGDGLDTIKPDELDVIIIAGMGGELITNILKESFDKSKSASSIVLQPMNSHEILRKWLYDNGFEIMDESLVSEGGKIYTVLTARWNEKYNSVVDDIHYYIGKALIIKRDPLLKVYINKKLAQLSKAISEIMNSENTNPEALEALNNHKWMRNELIKILESL